MSLPRRSHMLGPVAYAERGRCALPLHIGLRAPGKEHGEIDLHHIGCSVASHAGSPAVQPQGASATSPSRGAADPAFLFRTGGQYTIFRFFRLCGQMPQSLLLALACSFCDNRHGQVAVVHAPLFVPALCALRRSMGFSVGFYHVTFEIPAPYLLCPSQGDSEELF